MANLEDLITLAEARKQLRWPAGVNSDDAELEADYIPAATPIVEDIVGPIVRRAFVETLPGGSTSVLLSRAAYSITSVVVDGAAFTDFTADLTAGIVYGGGPTTPRPFLGGVGSVVVTYVAGKVADTAAVAKNHKMAARIIVARSWQSDHQGFTNPDETYVAKMVKTPSGFEIPSDAYAWLAGDTDDVMPGFA